MCFNIIVLGHGKRVLSTTADPTLPCRREAPALTLISSLFSFLCLVPFGLFFWFRPTASPVAVATSSPNATPRESPRTVAPAPNAAPTVAPTAVAAPPVDDELGFLGPGFVTGSFSATGVSDDIFAALGRDKGVARQVGTYCCAFVSFGWLAGPPCAVVVWSPRVFKRPRQQSIAAQPSHSEPKLYTKTIHHG